MGNIYQNPLNCIPINLDLICVYESFVSNWDLMTNLMAPQSFQSLITTHFVLIGCGGSSGEIEGHKQLYKKGLLNQPLALAALILIAMGRITNQPLQY